MAQGDLLAAGQAQPCRGATSTPATLLSHSRLVGHFAQHLISHGKGLLMALLVMWYMGWHAKLSLTGLQIRRILCRNASEGEYAANDLPGV